MNLLVAEKIFFKGQYIRVECLPFGIYRLVFARPAVRNAFSSIMIWEISHVLEQLKAISDFRLMRAIVFSAEGSAFSAGADLNDMAALAQATESENYQNALLLAKMFRAVASFPAPTLAVVQGAAVAGATGLLACLDHVVAAPNAKFALPEVRLGLVAATISPYLVRKLGAGHASSLMLTARRLNAVQALDVGLVHEISEQPGISALEKQLEVRVEEILMGAPNAQRISKELIIRVAPLPDDAFIEYTAQTLSRARSSVEGKDGLVAFFGHSTPSWCAEFVQAKKKASEEV